MPFCARAVSGWTHVFPQASSLKPSRHFRLDSHSGAVDGQSKVVMPFSVFQAVQRRLRCFGSLSSCKIQSDVSAPNIFVADLRRPRSYIWSIFWAFKFSVKSSKHPKPRCEKHPQILLRDTYCLPHILLFIFISKEN